MTVATHRRCPRCESIYIATDGHSCGSRQPAVVKPVENGQNTGADTDPGLNAAMRAALAHLESRIAAIEGRLSDMPPPSSRRERQRSEWTAPASTADRLLTLIGSDWAPLPAASTGKRLGVAAGTITRSLGSLERRGLIEARRARWRATEWRRAG